MVVASFTPYISGELFSAVAVDEHRNLAWVKASGLEDLRHRILHELLAPGVLRQTAWHVGPGIELIQNSKGWLC